MLTWTQPGTVWAIDHSALECPPLDGEWPCLFGVRDLASGRTLQTLPTPGTGSAEATAALEELFARFGAPLVVKLDNGSAYLADEFRQLARRQRVELLYSPGATPEYNGSCETGFGRVKPYLFYAALAAGRLQRPSVADLEIARLRSNQVVSHRDGATADERWSERTAISDELRAAFREACEDERKDERVRRQLELHDQLSHHETSSIDRAVLPRVLIDYGLLTIRRRLVSLPKKARRRARIT